jgi:undecaprenyl diphosphate synthase
MLETPTPTTIFDRCPILNEIPKERFPHHVFIIPDGNRRSATEHGLPPMEGHQAGLRKTLELLRVMRELPVGIASFWGFSVDNKGRSPEEQTWLMDLFNTNIPLNMAELIGYNARFVHLGDKDTLPPFLAKTLRTAEEQTKDNTGQIVCVAINFGGEDQEQRLVQKAAIEAVQVALANPTATPEEIAASFDRNKLISLRDAGGLIPPADLIIRTAEGRTSDVGWINGAGTELFFIRDKYFPELGEEDVVKAMVYFSHQNRKWGK